MSDFHELPLREQYERLQRLRAAAIAVALGDDDMLDRILGGIVDTTPDALTDGADLADVVDAWLAGGAA